MPANYILGPSHLHPDFTHQVAGDMKSRRIFRNCILDAYRGIPNWSKQIHLSLKMQHSLGSNLFWMVSDYKFNNADYPELREKHTREGLLFLNSVGGHDNVDKRFMEPEHIEFLGSHSLRVIDFLLGEFPDLKLIFWCLYKRTRVNKSSYPEHLWYDALKLRYASNILDLDLFTTPEGFSDLILDEGAHPNRSGYFLLDRMIVETATGRSGAG